jgi:hypothetical protein
MGHKSLMTKMMKASMPLTLTVHSMHKSAEPSEAHRKCDQLQCPCVIDFFSCHACAHANKSQTETGHGMQGPPHLLSELPV